MKGLQQRITAACVTALLVGVLSIALPSRALAEPRHGFNDEYIFATTRSVSEMDVNPALKVTLFPVTVILDTAFLPFALIAGCVG